MIAPITDSNNSVVAANEAVVLQPIVEAPDPCKPKTLTLLTEVAKNPQVTDFTKFEPSKYEFPTTTQELEYSLDYARYTTPLNLNMKKPTFMQQSNVNQLTSFANDVHADISKMHFLYS